jgi:hypothetical protein
MREHCCRCGCFSSSAALCSLVGVSTYDGGKSQTTDTSFYILHTVHQNEKRKKNMHMTVIDDEHNIQNVVSNNLETSATIITVSNWPEKRLSQ